MAGCWQGRGGSGKGVPYAFAMQYNNHYFSYYWYYHFLH